MRSKDSEGIVHHILQKINVRYIRSGYEIWVERSEKLETRGMITDITDPKCDVEECFRKFIYRFWDKNGGPGAVGGEFRQIDVWLWVLDNMKERHPGCFDQADNFVFEIIAAWKKVGFIKDRENEFLGPDNKAFEVVNLDDWFAS